MSFLAPALPMIAGAAGGLLGGLFGGATKAAPQVQYTPPGFNAGGLNAAFGGGSYNISPSADRTGLISNISNTFGQQAADIGGLRQQFAPGFSQLRQAQLDQIAANRAGAIGNLQQNLQNRRVLGSSFAQDAINRTTAEYNQQQAQTIAQTYLQELTAQQQLQQQQYEAARGQFQTGLTELNLEAGLAADLTGRASQTLAAAAQTQAQLNMFSQMNRSQFFGGIGSSLGSGFGRLLGGMSSFNPVSGAALGGG